MTAQEFAAMPDPIQGGKMELARGRTVVMAPVGPDHGRKAVRTARRLDQFSEEHDLGDVRVETGYWLASEPDDVRAPDVSFISIERLLKERVINGWGSEPPDLAVEVMSPNDRESDIADKVDAYLASGVLRVWVVRPEQKTVTVHRPGGDGHTYRVGDTLTSDDAAFSVEGFALPLAELFADR
ncbi:MAG: Uma2 family endonuclease [Gemmatimonadales bacterium]